MASCPALFLAAPASNQGKTTITAAMARYFSKAGMDVRVFKTGPDYLDPQILEQASGNPVIPLDLWMAGEDWCRHKLYEAARVADLILIEGAMGMFDGEPSSADLATTFGIPVAIVMDVKGMAQTAAAIYQGLRNFRQDVQIAGLIANNCGSERHATLIREGLASPGELLATLARREDVTLPERHLGLVQTFECEEAIEQALGKGCEWIADTALTRLPKPCSFEAATVNPPPPLLTGVSIGVARDAAFSFIYAANIACLESMGASVVFFSPLADNALPEVDALWLPGGYPELHAAQLSQNLAMGKAIQAFFEAGKPVLAECGGMLYCSEAIEDFEHNRFPMVNILKGSASFQGRRGCQGMQTALLPEGEIRAHAHHRSQLIDGPEPVSFGQRQRHPAPGEPIYRTGSLTASYLHLFFPSNPAAIASLFNSATMQTHHVA